MQVISADISHLPGILEIWQEFMDHHERIGSHTFIREDANEKFSKYIGQLIESEDAAVFVAVDGEKVAGFGVGKIELSPPVLKERKIGYIDTFAVRAALRRTGVGEKILDKLVEWFKNKGMKRLELRVADANEIGSSFWRKHGFRDYVHILCREVG